MSWFKLKYTTVFQTLFRINDSQKRRLSVTDVLIFNYVCIDENKMLSSTKVGWKFPIICFCIIIFISLFSFGVILCPIWILLPSGISSKRMMLGISSLGNVIPSYFPRKISYFPELLNTLKEKWGNTTVRLSVAKSCATESNVPGKKTSFCPL